MSNEHHEQQQSLSSLEESNEIELEWEEWDGKSPFLHHCLAGSAAGVAEHTLLYPVDTVKTHMQSYCADCPHNTSKAASAASSAGRSVSSGSSPTTGTARSQSAAAGVLKKSGGTAPPKRNGGVAAVQMLTSDANRVGSTTSIASSGNHQQGMWRTMRNLIYHGHSMPATASTTTTAITGVGPQRAAGSLASMAIDGGAITPTASTSATRAGFIRLWRGVQTMAVGCVPAHALYFSSYEAVKHVFLETTVDTKTGQMRQHLGAIGSSAAGATATLCHDLIMTPLDTVKQRLQLGHYNGMTHAIQQVIRHEGLGGLYRSFPITIMTNIPYGMVMVSTNEFLRRTFNPEGKFDLTSTIMAGCGAGAVAAAATAPLDRVKTRLQTQRLGAVMAAAQEAVSHTMATAAACDGKPIGLKCPKVRMESTAAVMAAMEQQAMRQPRYAGLTDAFRSIVREEGYAGLFRGVTPRLLTHAPAVAISWTTYEGAKNWLASSSF